MHMNSNQRIVWKTVCLIKWLFTTFVRTLNLGLFSLLRVFHDPFCRPLHLVPLMDELCVSQRCWLFTSSFSDFAGPWSCLIYLFIPLCIGVYYYSKWDMVLNSHGLFFFKPWNHTVFVSMRYHVWLLSGGFSLTVPFAIHCPFSLTPPC